MLIATHRVLRTFPRSAGHPFPCYCCLTTFVFTIPCVHVLLSPAPVLCTEYAPSLLGSRFRSGEAFISALTLDFEQQMIPGLELLQEDLIPCVVWRTGCGTAGTWAGNAIV